MGSRLRDHARALAESLATETRASPPGVLRGFETDEDGICVTLRLHHGGRDISLVLMFEDGYPRGTVLATSDDSHSTPHVRELNTSLELGAGGGGEGTDLFKTVCWVGEAFQCADEMAPVASRARQASRNAQQDHGASEFDVRTVTPTHDDTKHPNPSKTFKAPSRDGEERSDSGSGYGYSEDDDDDARSGSGSENDAPSNDDADLDHHGLESKNLSSSEITVLYQNKRKCEEREERRVAARLARLDTNDCDAPRSFEDTKNRTKSDAETETWEMKRCARDQIFSSEGAFQRLYAELFSLQKTQGIWVNGTFRTCKVQAVEHDVYEWDVRFPASAFEADLETLELVNGYDYVQLRISFKPDLYPFYPPRVRVVRPRLAGITPQALAAHPTLHLKNWQPFTATSGVLLFLQNFLQKHARVDLECDLNCLDMTETSLEGSYCDHPSLLESTLAKLAACGTSKGNPITPAAYEGMYGQTVENVEFGMDADTSTTNAFGDVGEDDVDLTTTEKDSEAVRLNTQRKEIVDKKSETWAKGTGYGHDGSGKLSSGGTGTGDGDGAPVRNWDATAARVAQSAEDGVVRTLIEETVCLIRIGVGVGVGSAAMVGGAAMAGGEDGGASCSGNGAIDARASAVHDNQPATATTNRFTKEFAKLGRRAEISRATTERVLRRSCVVAFITRELIGCAFMDMTERATYFGCLLDAVFALVDCGCADLLVEQHAAETGGRSGGKTKQKNPRPSQKTETSIASSLTEVAAQAEIYLRSMKASEGHTPAVTDETVTEHGMTAKVTATPPVTVKSNDALTTGSSAIDSNQEWHKTARLEISLARRILSARDAVVASVSGNTFPETSQTEAELPNRRSKRDTAAKGKQTTKTTAKAGKTGSSKEEPGEDLAKPGKSNGKPGGRLGKKGATSFNDSEEFVSEAAYVVAMRPLVFDVSGVVSGDGDGPGASDTNGDAGAGPSGTSSGGTGRKHAFLDDATRDLKTGPHLVRVAREMAGLTATLPLSRSSTALVRVDEERSVLWSVGITGPEETPYDAGFFTFDTFFPSGYPTCAPKIKFKTTGGGRCRLNPNLYKDGKVCLSLLGTWQGAQGETWDASVSTITQVIISIQSLIFVNQPFFNEPGYERTMGTVDGTKQSDAYNVQIVEYVVRYAMLEQLRKPVLEFADAIFEHFKRRRAYILGPLKTRWEKEAGPPSSEPRKKLDGLFKELAVELEEL